MKKVKATSKSASVPAQAPETAGQNQNVTGLARRGTGDSFINLQAQLGYGAGSQQDASGFQFDLVSRNRIQMEAAYRSNWVCGMGVDVVAEDMTRQGIELNGKMDPEDDEKIMEAISRLKLNDSICDTIKWGRLYGGAIAVILIDGQKLSTPLRIETVSKDQFKGLYVFDRWMVQPSLTDLVQEYGPDMGKPRFYQAVAQGYALGNEKIHHSRIIRIDGLDLPFWQRISENMWGQSVLERIWDRIIAFDSATEGAAQLVYKAYLRNYKIPGFRDIVATGGDALKGVVKQVEMIRKFQSNEGLTIMDAEDEMEMHSYTFAGLGDMVLQFAQQLSGALQIPLVRLLGQSPAGLNSTGDGDLKTYYDNIKQQQNRRLRSGWDLLLRILCRSELGRDVPEGFSFEFRSLWQLDDTEKANITKTVTDAIVAAENAGIIDNVTALKELRGLTPITGAYGNITDDVITEAENAPPEPTELDPLNPDPNANPSPPAPKPGQTEKGPAAVRRPAAKDSKTRR